MLTILFPSEPFSPRKVDSCFAEEYEAADKAGLVTALINQEELDAGDIPRAVQRINGKGEKALYRGWMLDVEKYGGLYQRLQMQGVDLINNPRQYMNCHWFPGGYGAVQDFTPESTWVTMWADGSLEIGNLVEWVKKKFGDSPVIIKDFVKSRKHEWEEACFVPCASDEEAFMRVVNTFIERQGGYLTGGVVARKYVPLKKIGNHPKSGMPMFNEYRVFFLNGKLMTLGHYWGDNIQAANPDLTSFANFTALAADVDSNFFTMDIAETEEGDWIVIELGDGQVSGLQGYDPYEFYCALKDGGRHG